MEKILNKRKVQEKNKYLVRWKGFMAERDTWESRENCHELTRPHRRVTQYVLGERRYSEDCRVRG